MNDIWLWRRLTSGAIDGDGGDEAGPLIEALRELAHQPLRGRAAFIPALVTLAGSQHPDIRSAAIAGLAGCRGVRGLAAVIAALDDPEPPVWTAACRALAVTGASVPVRLAHGLFHRRVEVRRQLLLDGLPVAAAELGAYLRGDPECRALATLCPWPKSSLPLAVGLFEDGAIEADELCDRVAVAHPGEITDLAGRRLGRSAEVVDAYLESPSGSPPGIDVFDSIAGALAELERRGRAHRGAISVLADAAFSGRSIGLDRRIAAALVGAEPRPELGLELAIALVPSLVAVPAVVSARERGAAVSGLHRYRDRIGRLPAREVRRLLAAPIVGDGPDIALGAALVGLRPDRRLETLAKTFGDEAIVSAIGRSDADWLAICRLPRETPPRWRRWLEAAEARDAARGSELTALALSVWVRDRPRLDEAIRELERQTRGAALVSLARLAHAGRVELASDRLSVLAELMAARLIPSAATELLTHLLALDTADARELVAALSRELPARRLTDAALAADPAPLVRFLEAIDGPQRLPWDRELALAKALVSSDHPEVAEWAQAILDSVNAPPPASPELPPDRARALTGDERAAISAASASALKDALRPALDHPSLGLCEALGRRPPPENRSLPATTALLGSFDLLADVATQLDRFASWDAGFVDRVDTSVRRWLHRDELPPQANAALFRWERNNFALVEWIERRGGLLAALAMVGDLGGAFTRMIFWRGIAEVVVLLRYRDRERLAPMIDERLMGDLITAIGGPTGRYAARMLVAIFEAKLSPVPLASLADGIADRAADADQITRGHLARLMRLDGLPPPARTEAPVLAMRDRLAAIAASSDLDELEEACRLPARRLVEEAVLRLMLLGAAGEARLARLVGELLTLPCPAPLIASVEMWTDAAALEAVRALTASESPEIRMRVALALCARGETELAAVAVDAARAPLAGGASWFATEDYETLAQLVDPDELAAALIDAPHHRAYRPAFAHLMTAEPAPWVRDSLVRFLETGDDRPIGLRRNAARTLLATWSLAVGMPIILEEYTDPSGANIDLDRLPRSADLDRFVETVAWMALIGGPEVCAESRAVDAARAAAGDNAEALWSALLEGSLQSTTRQIAAQMLSGLSSRLDARADSGKRRIAETFAWGVRRGRELTGRLYRVHMTSAERALGHTYLDEDRIFVSTLPMLRNERNGRDIVEGLILHELGHHVWHRGRRAAQIWKEANERGLFSLLNLIADEHLERNLRAIDTRFGDRLKRLGAYAFQHAAQEIELSWLLETLGASAAPALIGTPLELAYDESAVRISRGAILGELDRRGHPLARFARALRMGLGDRGGDALVAKALARFDRRFRRLDMEGLWKLTLEIAELFGGRVAVADVFGGPEGITWSDRDGEVFGAGVDDDDIQREVERILDPRRSGGDRDGRLDRLTINVNPEEAFDRITRVERISPDPDRHRELASEVKRHAMRLRGYLKDLGLQYVPVGARVSGRHLDRTRIRALVTRGDPRILRARQLVSENDLFIGVTVDCSSSMHVGDNLSRAQRFGVLVAEAVRGLAGVDARFFGFTDSALYDAGDEERCAVAALPLGGGNNDAAALYHLAQEAQRSRRRARVLVMISDGLPTQCSVAALRGLVANLSRRQLLCAQVAVRPLEEICFPNYVLLDTGEIDAAVAQFGRMVGDLARRALGA